jgi:hypothetical protein
VCDRIITFAKEALKIFVRKVLLYAVILSILVCLSFIFFDPFSFAALSERLFWTGLGVALIGAILVFGQTAGGRDYGVPGMFIRSAHVNAIIDWNIEIRKNLEKKFDFTIQLFFVGMIIFLLGILVDRVFV